MDNFFSADLISCVHMSTIYCCEKKDKVVKGCQQAFTLRPKHVMYMLV